MHRTPKPLVILVTDESMLGWPGLQKLMEQGHTVVTLEQWGDSAGKGEPRMTPDLVMGPSAWYMDRQHDRYMEKAIKAARARRYPGRKVT